MTLDRHARPIFARPLRILYVETSLNISAGKTSERAHPFRNPEGFAPLGRKYLEAQSNTLLKLILVISSADTLTRSARRKRRCSLVGQSYRLPTKIPSGSTLPDKHSRSYQSYEYRCERVPRNTQREFLAILKLIGSSAGSRHSMVCASRHSPASRALSRISRLE